ncbi:hypothetical protein F1D05_13335 [Kribbella qitaiheensis]|uniref:Uncharacterized protein n=1 Tax=Kribbella qitaiheensis TaxID=1544730 RepID=A0A7G6WXJ7_9ACTN|nr:hypothetical protein [Kribbella qitaiheensis]QNE18712.1 hypothetical protein F1D05_13335 [Kribbella qitaiheensis]
MQIEDAVERIYGAVRFSRQFIEQTRTHVAAALSNHQRSARLLKQQLQSEVQALDVKENNLLDLAADGSLPQAKIKERLRGIERQRHHLSERLGEEAEDFTDDARLIELSLTLLEDPQALYRRCDDDQKRLLNQAIFHRLYLDEDDVTGHELRQPFAGPARRPYRPNHPGRPVAVSTLKPP